MEGAAFVGSDGFFLGGGGVGFLNNFAQPDKWSVRLDTEYL